MKIFHFLCMLALGAGLMLVSCQPQSTADTPSGNDNLSKDSSNPPPTNKEAKKTTEGVSEDYTNTDRVIWQKPDLVLGQLGNLEGKTVADIGAGTGFFAIRMAQKAKKVIAIDIDPRFTAYLDSIKVLELPEALQSRLETRLGAPNDPKLAPNEADAVVIVNTFMYIRNQVEYLATLKKGLKPGGKVLIVDFKKKRTPVGPPPAIRSDLYSVEEALYQAGYKRIVANDTALDYQYIIIGEN